MYKDKDKQRKAVREATKRYRERQRVRESCVIPDRDTNGVIPSDDPAVIPSTKLFREECVTCEHLGGDENDKAVCAVVDGCACVYDKVKPEPQSHNSMMVGYVPPTE